MPPPIPRGLLVGDQLDFVTTATDLTVAATTAAGADTFLTSGEVRVDGVTRLCFEFFSMSIDITTTQGLQINLWEDGVDLGRIGNLQSNGGLIVIPFYTAVYRTPAPGKHTYVVKAWKTGGTAHVTGNNSATAMQNAYLRITRA